MQNNIKQQLMSELSRRNIDLVTQWILEKPEAIGSLVDLVLSHNDIASPRATWVLEKLSEKMNEPVADYLDRIIGELRNVTSSSTRRTLSKVLMLHTLPEKHEGVILDFCISMIESAKEPVAVKANCMTIVFNLLPKYPDLKNEIFALIEDQIPFNTVGFGSRFNVLKRKMK
jgi:hypothetical protein